jgi:hypothetical protein
MSNVVPLRPIPPAIAQLLTLAKVLREVLGDDKAAEQEVQDERSSC